jgi:hypothetical protein
MTSPQPSPKKEQQFHARKEIAKELSKPKDLLQVSTTPNYFIFNPELFFLLAEM